MTATLWVDDGDDSNVPAKVTENDMLRHLWRHFADRWAPIPQVTVAPTDLSPSAHALETIEQLPANDGTERRIDMLLCRRAPNPDKAGPYETLAVEVKVTRADFVSDIRNPAKQEPWKKAATRHTYAVPAGLVQPHEVPDECGLLWVTPPPAGGWQAEVKWVKKAPYIRGHRPQLPARVMNTLIFRLSTFEARTRDWVGLPHTVGSEQEIRASLTAAEKRIADLERQLTTAQGKETAWKAAYSLAAPEGIPCGICGRPLRPLRPSGSTGWFGSWRHTDAADDEPCRLSEIAQAEATARADYAAASTADREARLRSVHRRAFNAQVEAEPWRAWMPHVVNVPTPALGYEPTPDDELTAHRRRLRRTRT